MRKLLAIIVLGLLFSGNAYAKCISGDCKNGSGTMVTKTGKYVGEFKKGKLDGQGIFIFKDGKKYEGEFKKNKIQGLGTLISTLNGETYTGEWKNNKIIKGTLIFTDGRKYEGKFKKGQTTSEGTWTTVKTQETNHDISKPIKIPVYPFILKVDEENFKTSTTKIDIIRDFEKVNEIWSQANISFYIKQIKEVNPNLKGFSENVKWAKKNFPQDEKKIRKHIENLAKGKKSALSKTNKIIKIQMDLINFETNDKNNILQEDGLNIFYFPKLLSAACGRALTPKTSERKVNNDGLIYIGSECPSHDLKDNNKKYEISYVLSHELGHMLGIPDHSNLKNNFIEAGGGSDGTKITNQQAKKMRDYFFYYLKKFK